LPPPQRVRPATSGRACCPGGLRPAGGLRRGAAWCATGAASRCQGAPRPNLAHLGARRCDARRGPGAAAAHDLAKAASRRLGWGAGKVVARPPPSAIAVASGSSRPISASMSFASQACLKSLTMPACSAVGVAGACEARMRPGCCCPLGAGRYGALVALASRLALPAARRRARRAAAISGVPLSFGDEAGRGV
jgi:hypothetical protein